MTTPTDYPAPPPRVRLPTPERPLRLYNCACIPAMQQLPSESFDACITDPPYGVNYRSGFPLVASERFDRVANDTRPYIWWFDEARRLLRDGGCMVCFTYWDTAEAFRSAMTWAGLDVGAQLVWDKRVHSMGDLSGTPGAEHETAWFATKGRYAFPGGVKRPTTMYRFPRPVGGGTRHPTQKPDGLLEKLVADYTAPGAMILEPFAGSGSTALAAYRSGRMCFATELDSGHHAGAVREYERLQAEEASGLRTRPAFGPRPDYDDKAMF